MCLYLCLPIVQNEQHLVNACHVHFIAIIQQPALPLKTNTEVDSVWLILWSPVEGDSYCVGFNLGREYSLVMITSVWTTELLCILPKRSHDYTCTNCPIFSKLMDAMRHFTSQHKFKYHVHNAGAFTSLLIYGIHFQAFMTLYKHRVPIMDT